MSVQIPASAVEIGHILAGADRAEVLAEHRPHDAATVVDIVQRPDGRLALAVAGNHAHSVRRDPDEMVEVVQEIPPSTQMAAALPEGWRIGGRPNIAEFLAVPGDWTGPVAQVSPGTGGRWHAHVSRPGEKGWCDQSLPSFEAAAEAATRALGGAA